MEETRDKNQFDVAAFERLATIMPWELSRARRAANQLTYVGMWHAQTILDYIAEELPTSQFAQRNLGARDWEISQTTPLLSLFPYYYWDRTQLNWVDGAMNRNIARLLLALQAWRLEHGQLPESLQELVGVYFERLPRDPFSGEDFRYFPQGVPEQRETFLSTHRKITPPLLWCCGPRLMPVDSNQAEQEYAEVGWWGSRSTKTGFFGNMMQLGKSVEIPSPVVEKNAREEASATDAPAHDEKETPPEAPTPPAPPEAGASAEPLL